MRIAIVAPPLTISWGWHRQAIELALSLSYSWHDVHVFARYVDFSRCFPDKIKLLNLHFLSEGQEPMAFVSRLSVFGRIKVALVKFLLDRKNAKDIWGLLSKVESDIWNFDIVNLHDVEVSVAPFLKTWKIVWMMNDLPWIHGDPDSFVGDKGFMFSLLFKAYNHFLIYWVRHLCSKIDDITVLDERNRSIVMTLFQRDAKVVRSWIDLEKFKYLTKDWWKSTWIVRILCTWILFRHRRFEDVIRAIGILTSKGMTNIRLTVVWRTDLDSVYYDELLKLVASLNLSEYVIFKWLVTEEELLEAYAVSDVFVFPNSPQTWWLAVFEAMLAGCLVILTDWCWAHEVLKHGDNCLIYRSWDFKGLALLMNDVVKNKGFDWTLSLNWAEFVKKNLSWDRFSNDMLEIFSTWKSR